MALLSLKKGVWEEGDPKNRLIEIAFDRYPGPDVHAKQEKLLSSFFGWEDSLTQVKHDENTPRSQSAGKRKTADLANCVPALDWPRANLSTSKQTLQDSGWRRLMDVGRGHILARATISKGSCRTSLSTFQTCTAARLWRSLKRMSLTTFDDMRTAR